MRRLLVLMWVILAPAALGEIGKTTPEAGALGHRGYLLTELSDLRLLVSSQAELDRRIRQSACLVDSTGGMSEERGVEIRVDCDTTLKAVLDHLPRRSDINIRRVRIIKRDQIIQYRGDTDECGRVADIERFYGTIIARGDVVAICALK